MLTLVRVSTSASKLVSTATLTGILIISLRSVARVVRAKRNANIVLLLRALRAQNEVLTL